MLEIILDALKKNKIDVYQILKKETESAEAYFIKKELDMRRLVNLVSYEVRVYRDFEQDGKKMRGCSDVKIFPQMSADEVDKTLSEAYYAASFAANPYFPLPAGSKETHVDMPGRLTNMPVEQAVDAFVESLYKADCQKDSWINSAEFFVTRHNISICNSEGIDVSYTKSEAKGEFVVQCTQPQDVEQYFNFAYNDLDTDSLTTLAKEALTTTLDRARATEAPRKGTYDVIISDREMAELFSFYVARSAAHMIYPGYSRYRKGTMVQGENVTGESANLTMKATDPYSQEGIHMQDLELIRSGELLALTGTARFAYYLGIKPTGQYNAVQVDNGTKSMDELKSTPYLHVVSFSSFDMDSFTGNFGGEIRLAYLYDGEKTAPVTGGSINGNFLELQKNMVFSMETYRDSRYAGPRAVKFYGVPVAGQ